MWLSLASSEITDNVNEHNSDNLELRTKRFAWRKQAVHCTNGLDVLRATFFQTHIVGLDMKEMDSRTEGKNKMIVGSMCMTSAKCVAQKTVLIKPYNYKVQYILLYSYIKKYIYYA